MILGFGYIFMELGLRVPHIDPSGSIVTAESMMLSPGGRALNQALAAARMGGKVSLIGAVGEDLFGKNILDRLQREGITRTGILRAEGNTGIMTYVHDAHGQNVNVASDGVNRMIKSLQVPLMALNQKTLIMLQDDVAELENIALLRRARDNNAFTIMNLRTAEQFYNVERFVDVLVVRDDVDIPDHPALVRYTPDLTPGFDPYFAEDCFCGALAACIQAGMDFSNALNHAQTMAHLAGSPKDVVDRFPYLDSVLKALPVKPESLKA